MLNISLKKVKANQQGLVGGDYGHNIPPAGLQASLELAKARLESQDEASENSKQKRPYISKKILEIPKNRISDRGLLIHPQTLVDHYKFLNDLRHLPEAQQALQTVKPASLLEIFRQSNPFKVLTSDEAKEAQNSQREGKEPLLESSYAQSIRRKDETVSSSRMSRSQRLNLRRIKTMRRLELKRSGNVPGAGNHGVSALFSPLTSYGSFNQDLTLGAGKTVFKTKLEPLGRKVVAALKKKQAEGSGDVENQYLSWRSDLKVKKEVLGGVRQPGEDGALLKKRGCFSSRRLASKSRGGAVAEGKIPKAFKPVKKLKIGEGASEAKKGAGMKFRIVRQRSEGVEGAGGVDLSKINKKLKNDQISDFSSKCSLMLDSVPESTTSAMIGGMKNLAKTRELQKLAKKSFSQKHHFQFHGGVLSHKMAIEAPSNAPITAPCVYTGMVVEQEGQNQQKSSIGQKSHRRLNPDPAVNSQVPRVRRRRLSGFKLVRPAQIAQIGQNCQKVVVGSTTLQCCLKDLQNFNIEVPMPVVRLKAGPRPKSAHIAKKNLFLAKNFNLEKKKVKRIGGKKRSKSITSKEKKGKLMFFTAFINVFLEKSASLRRSHFKPFSVSKASPAPNTTQSPPGAPIQAQETSRMDQKQPKMIELAETKNQPFSANSGLTDPLER